MRADPTDPARDDPPGRTSGLAQGLKRLFAGRPESRMLTPMHGWPARTVLIQNYHPTACLALVRDFKKIGFRVVSPDSDWNRISYYASNAALGSELISQSAYMALPPGYILITCKPHEIDMRNIAHQHHDRMILNIAEHQNTYQTGLGDILLCPDIQNYENYPNSIRHKLLYFMRPFLSQVDQKDIAQCYQDKQICCYISKPQIWVEGTATYQQFKALYPHQCRFFGLDSPDGVLTPAETNANMARSFFTVHFKEKEAYGLSCLESMMLGTPVVSLNRFMADKTLGRFFLSPETAIVTDTVEQAVERLEALTLEQYRAMSLAAHKRVMELTSDSRTVDRLDAAIREYSPA